MSLAIRKFLASPLYWIGWRLIRLADKVDGKQPKGTAVVRPPIYASPDVLKPAPAPPTE